MVFISEDKRTINLPVPLGTYVYQYWTRCNDACLFQKEAFNKAFPPGVEGRCSGDMPCHTRPHLIKPVELSLSNLDWVLRDWGKTVFATENEARTAMNTAIELHKAQLVALGMVV